MGDHERSPGARAAPGLEFLVGGGVTGALARSVDWAQTPIGPPTSWPPELKVTLGILFHSRQPMFLWWGPELVQFYNDAYLPSFGVGKHPRAMGQRGEECWPEIWPIIGPQIRDVMEHGIPSWNENQLVPIWRNGKIEDVYWTYGYSPVYAADGSIGGTLVICQETTNEVLNRREIDRAHAEAEAARTRLAQLVENAPAFMAMLDGPEHVFSMVNRPYLQLVGAGRDIVGLRLIDALPEVVEQGFLEVLDAVFRTGEPFVGRETRVELARGGDGTLEDAYVTFVYQPRRDVDGYVCGVDAFGFDVTALVRARAEAEEAHAESRALAEAIPQQVWTAGPDGAIDFVNHRLREFFGPDVAIQLDWPAFVHPDDREATLARWSRSIATGEPYEVEFRLRRADGQYVWHLGRAVPLRGASGDVVEWFGTNTDIDEARRAREQLRERAELERYLVGIVSHDLRNPLQAILLGASALVLDDGLDEASANIARRVESAAKRGSRMVHDLLDFTRVRLGSGIPIAPRRADLHELAAQVVDEVRAGHPGRALVLETSGDGAGRWDPGRLAQVIANLLGNAMAYGDPARPVTVSTKGEGSSAIVEVHNFGAPIPAELESTLFSPLQRAGSETHGRSIGLGLFIVKAIVTQHGGDVEVESDASAGTTFRVRLPRIAPARMAHDAMSQPRAR